MSPDARHDGALVGREAELAQMVRNLALGRHTLVVGEPGAGKSRLLAEARRVLAGAAHRPAFAAGLARAEGRLAARLPGRSRRTIVLDHPSPLSAAVRDALRALWEGDDLHLDTPCATWAEARAALAGSPAAEHRALVLEGLARAPDAYIIFLDNVRRLSPLQEEFFAAMAQVATLCAAGGPARAAAADGSFWLGFDRIVLRPLGAPEAATLVEHLERSAPVLVVDPAMYRRELLAASDGNPAAIRALHWRSSREPVVPLEEIRALRRSERARYFNMGPAYIFIVALLTLVRVLAIGTGNTEFMIYFSALGFVAYLAFRVFRPFFVFRPRGEEGED